MHKLQAGSLQNREPRPQPGVFPGPLSAPEPGISLLRKIPKMPQIQHQRKRCPQQSSLPGGAPPSRARSPHSPAAVSLPHAGESFQPKPGAVGEANPPGAGGRQRRVSAFQPLRKGVKATGALPDLGVGEAGVIFKKTIHMASSKPSACASGLGLSKRPAQPGPHRT